MYEVASFRCDMLMLTYQHLTRTCKHAAWWLASCLAKCLGRWMALWLACLLALDGWCVDQLVGSSVGLFVGRWLVDWLN